MNRKCIIPNCEISQKYFNCKLFKFPGNATLRKKWAINCGLNENFNYKNKRLCGRHFEKKFIGKKRLLEETVPTLELPIIPVYINEDRVSKAKYSGIKCCIKMCTVTKRKHTNFKFFKFPKNENLLAKWISACEFSDTLNATKSFVCEKHFEKKCIGAKKLLPGAVPSIKLKLDDYGDSIEVDGGNNYIRESESEIDHNPHNCATEEIVSGDLPTTSYTPHFKFGTKRSVEECLKRANKKLKMVESNVRDDGEPERKWENESPVNHIIESDMGSSSYVEKTEVALQEVKTEPELSIGNMENNLWSDFEEKFVVLLLTEIHGLKLLVTPTSCFRKTDTRLQCFYPRNQEFLTNQCFQDNNDWYELTNFEIISAEFDTQEEAENCIEKFRDYCRASLNVDTDACLPKQGGKRKYDAISPAISQSTEPASRPGNEAHLSCTSFAAKERIASSSAFRTTPDDSDSDSDDDLDLAEAIKIFLIKQKSQSKRLKKQMKSLEIYNLSTVQHLEDIKRQNEDLKNQNDALQNQIQLLTAMSSAQKKKSTIVVDPNFNCPKWPLKTVEELDELNRNLSDATYRNQVFIRIQNMHFMVNYTDKRKSIKRFFEKIVTYDVLIQYSWSGKTSIDSDKVTKLEFLKMNNITMLIMDLFGDNVELRVIENEIKYFMKRVPQYYKNRQKLLNIE